MAQGMRSSRGCDSAQVMGIRSTPGVKAVTWSSSNVMVHLRSLTAEECYLEAAVENRKRPKLYGCTAVCTVALRSSISEDYEAYELMK